MRSYLILVVTCALVSGCGETSNRTGAAFSASGEIVAMSGGEGGPGKACFACHGLDGLGDGVDSPRLAGLDAGYLQKQMEDYANGLRSDDVMTPVAKSLDQAARRAVSNYYAALPVPLRTNVAAAPAPSAYFRGDPSLGLPSCAACHGARGEGLGPGGPQIAAQPADYTREQLRRWRTAERRNDPRGVMRTAAGALTPAETAAIATWLAAQPAPPVAANTPPTASDAPQAAERPAASRAGHRLDPRRGVSGPLPRAEGSTAAR